LAVVAGLACGPDVDPQQDVLVRERTAARFRDHKDLARATLAPLVARKDATAADLVTAAAIELADGKDSACAAFLDRAEKVDPNSAAVAYLRGQLARLGGDFQAAVPQFRKAHELAPLDLPSRLCLAEALAETDDEKGAETLYRSVVDVGLENGQIWYATAVYRLARLLSTSGREEEAEPFNRRWAEFEKRGANSADSTTRLLLGDLGKVVAPRPQGSTIPPPRHPPEFAAPRRVLPEFAGARELEPWDLDGDVRPDLAAVGDKGILVAFSRPSGFLVKTAVDGAVELARAADVDNDADLDFLVVQGGSPALFLQDKESWTRSPLELPPLPSPPRDAIPVDFDHDGDVDLLVTGDFGARIWRNDAATTPGQGHGFVDASEKSGLPSNRAIAWGLTEDFDGDNDVDLLLGGPQALILADSLREGRFAEKAAAFPAGATLAERPLAADLDGDARPDLWTPSAVWRVRPDGRFESVPRKGVSPASSALVRGIDLDLDGSLDLLWSDAAGRRVEALLAAGLPAETRVEIESVDGAPVGPIAAADFDGNRSMDLAVLTADGVSIRDGKAGPNQGVRLSYRGARSNRRAVGSVVEYRAGGVYRRIYWRGEPVLAGVGTAPKLDVLRITWPNGIVQTDLDLDLQPQGGVDDPDAAFKSITEASAQFGSCPFLYARNAEGTVFVSDVLGGTPLGLPARPGVLVPFRNEEYVLVRGSELGPVAGVLELHLTEELREVTYLDEATLVAVDHPSTTEILPNELFCFPPFPEPYLHSLEARVAPVRATGSDGKDWTAALASSDGLHASPFVLEDPQYPGHAKPWFLELEFDREALARAPKLRLAMRGWVFWSDSTANVAAAGAGLAFVPPTLQVPDGNGGFQDAGPPVGFPSGKTKTMVVDVTQILRRDDPRIRVATTLRLYWDEIRLAVDAGDGERIVRELPRPTARLWPRGFSAPLGTSGLGRRDDPRPECFDWDRLTDKPRWNQTPGNYTRYGDCTPLLAQVDDRYAMIGAGDALTLRFDAGELPPPAKGFSRDWILHLDGWCKDADLNTVAAETVEPLPFHGMSAYPYPAAEHFPDDEAHRTWRAEWNTREAYRWIQPVSPVREIEWLAGE